MLPVHLEQVRAQFLPRGHRCVMWYEGLLPVAVCQLLTQGAGPGHLFSIIFDVWPIVGSSQCLGETDGIGQDCLLADSLG